MSFMLALPKISLHGAGAIGDMVKLVAGKGWGKALIVTDGHLVKMGLLDSLFTALDEQQMSYHLFDEVFPNPTEALVQKGYAAYRETGCDYLIAFGGGSPIDTAKAVKILTANPGPSTAYSGVGKVKNAGVPLVAINTTAGTAAEMTSNAVIIDAERQVKEVIIDPNIIPDIAVDDASVMLDIPPSITAATGMDALTHAVGLGVGLLCGLFNGLLVTRLNLSSIVITIGTMSLYRGMTYILLGDKALNHYPDSFAWFGQGYVWGALSFEFALFILLAIAFAFLLHKTNFGRRTYAIGNNPTGAWFSGINVKRHNLVLFALVGLMSGLAAVLLTSRLGSTRPTLAMGWELAVVTMAVLGGINILGGSGSMVGVIIAAFLMGLVTFGLSLLNVPGIVMSIIIGAMLIVVISLPIITRRVMQRRRI